MTKYQDLSATEQKALQHEFENKDTTDERRVEILGYLREGANEAKMGRPCPRCKNYPFHAPWIYGLTEGHVYSGDGLREVRITGYCEFCFDLITQEPDEDDGWKQQAIAQDIQFMADSMGPGTTVRRLSEDEVRDLFKDQ